MELYDLVFLLNAQGVPLRPSASDLQILEAKAQILNAPPVENDPELYSPVFRNISMFKR